jgi:hypothetical protein
MLVEAGRVLRKVPSYILQDYIVLPFGLDAEGNAVVARVPQDDSGRVAAGILWSLASTNGNVWLAVADALDYARGQFPSPSPYLTAAGSAIEYAAGANPYDYFRRRSLFTDDEQAARRADHATWEPLKKFVGWELQQLGAGILWKFYAGGERPEQKTPSQQLLDLPVLSNIIGRFVMVTKYGDVERTRAPGLQVKANRSLRIITEKQAVQQTLRAYQNLPASQKTPRRQQELGDQLARTL